MYEPLLRWLKKPQKYTKSGYVLVWVPEHPNNFNGWFYEHRLVYERHAKRILETWETVHHINQIKDDNKMRNLFACTEREHKKAHRR